MERNTHLSGSLLKDSRIGIWKFNFPDQKVQIQIEYSNNIPSIEKYYIINSNTLYSGLFKYKDDEKGILEERKIKNGLRNGKTIYIDAISGKTIKKVDFKDGLIE